ncbi:Cytochrome-c3 hydrogenase [Desulfurobacterium thermolithotrophum DSM 11699]|uniref:Cytochrome-c3 hydrogenase n=1 Tax=Desulfurobacterium thermolithotrophum (strain DSM 11699 / BSA) TaxID=868864 RepID=F0S2N6_DESTD|nr:nickel-dependent hydrogenase large subunit [Desulfurobacterium thermolithotrophum]ADY73108.1 Cytochrome-c3 hydrogenase [Desulfurobacterium thermolithotrophum DSM 11699]
MAKRVVIDPVTRIEGHLRIEVVPENGYVKNAYSSAQMWRGLEVILQGRNPDDAWMFVQRICGVCTTVHALASVRSVENALQLEIPYNAQMIRNIIIAAHALHDHIVHFYHLSALDWVDIVSALKADPQKAAKIAESYQDWKLNGASVFKAVQDKLRKFVESGQLGPFANGYWGHPAMKLSPEVNLIAVTHYLQALDYQRKATQAVAILGGKFPHIQNLAVGGVSTAINLDNEATLNMERLYYIKQLLEEVREFVHNCYLPDVIAISAFYKEWLNYGRGVDNYLAVPDLPQDTKGEVFDLPGGTIIGGNLSTVKPIKSFNDPYFINNVAENITHSWYKGDWTRHPWEEDTIPEYTGMPGGYVDGNEKYSWSKAPRFRHNGNYIPMQVGPLAQVLVGYAQGHKLTKKYVDQALSMLSSLAGTKADINALQSTPGRHIARAIRAQMLSDLALKQWEQLVDNVGRGDYEIFNPPSYPAGEIKGCGFHEAPRGTLSHWCVIENGKLKNYQAVVPSTWNASPRDGKGQMGPYEASLIGNPIAEPEKPLEVLRTVHSFDPCIACAVHMVDTEGEEIVKVKAL